MAITNVRFSFTIDRTKPEALLGQLQAKIKAELANDQEPLRYAIVSLSGSKAVVEVSVLDKRGLV